MVPIDPRSFKPVGENEPSVDRFLRDEKAMTRIKASAKIENGVAQRYDAIFLPGGHGTMWDLPANAAPCRSHRRHEGQREGCSRRLPQPGLVNARDRNGQPIVAGRRVSAFTNAEEQAAGLTDVVPFLLETRLRELGARFEGVPDFQPYAVADGKLVTGQNPMSSKLVAGMAMELLRTDQPHEATE